MPAARQRPEFRFGTRHRSGERLRRVALGMSGKFPLAAEGGGADAAGGGGDVGAARPRQARNKGRTRGTGGSLAAPQSEIARGGEGAADRGEILGLVRDRRGRPVAGGE